MADVEIKFEREGLDGVVAVGTYLIDAMKRFGIRLEGVCVIPAGEHYCTVAVTGGSENLSPFTADETEYFKEHAHALNDRLACQAVIEKAGEVGIMTKEKKEDETSEEKEKSDDYRKAFQEMPLEKKIASLVQLEAIALGETFSFILNSPFKVFEKIGDVMAEFGIKLEKESKAAGRPKEHTQQNSSGNPEPEKEQTEEKAGKSAEN